MDKVSWVKMCDAFADEGVVQPDRCHEGLGALGAAKAVCPASSWRSTMRIVYWREVGTWALLFNGKLVTAGRQKYVEHVMSSAPLGALQAARDGICWEVGADG